jgi:hypothetical protein
MVSDRECSALIPGTETRCGAPGVELIRSRVYGNHWACAEHAAMLREHLASAMRRRARRQRAARAGAYRSNGMVQVKGNLGGTYWE